METVTVLGTLDELSELTAELASKGGYVVSPPERSRSRLLERNGDAQLEVLSISIAVAEGLVAAALYDQIKALVNALHKRGKRSLRIEGKSKHHVSSDGAE